MAAGLLVKNWERFQHYRNRRPPWIKLHRTLLDDISYLRLPVASMAIAPLVWLLASEGDGYVPADIADLSFRLRMPEKVVDAGVKGLIAHGFLVAQQGSLADENDMLAVENDTLAARKQDAPLEGEREEEGGGEGETPSPASSTTDQGIADEWNAMAKAAGLPLVQAMPDHRRAAVLARVAKYGRERASEVIRNVGASAFLTGKKFAEGKRPFRATFDWTFGPQNFLKVLEGNYNDRSRATTLSAEDAARAERIRLLEMDEAEHLREPGFQDYRHDVLMKRVPPRTFPEWQHAHQPTEAN